MNTRIYIERSIFRYGDFIAHLIDEESQEGIDMKLDRELDASQVEQMWDCAHNELLNRLLLRDKGGKG